MRMVTPAPAACIVGVTTDTDCSVLFFSGAVVWWCLSLSYGFVNKMLFSLSKISFLMRKGLLKAPLGDPSEELRTEGAEGEKKRPPGVKKYGFA